MKTSVLWPFVGNSHGLNGKTVSEHS